MSCFILSHFLNRKVTAFLVLLLSARAVAVDGYNARSGGPESVCRIIIRNEDGSLAGICSGLLTKTNEVLSAAHCFDDAIPENVSVQCGYQGFLKSEAKVESTKAGNYAYTKGPRFSEIHAIADIQIHSHYDGGSTHDIATLLLASKSNIQPLEVAKPGEVEQVFLEKPDRLRSDVRCQIAGYGLRSGVAGLLNHGFLSQDIEIAKSFRGPITLLVGNVHLSLHEAAALEDTEKLGDLIRDIPRIKSISVSGLNGDSGSSLLCQKSNGSWKSMGVTSTVFINPVGETSEEVFVGVNYWNPTEPTKKKSEPPPLP